MVKAEGEPAGPPSALIDSLAGDTGFVAPEVSEAIGRCRLAGLYVRVDDERDANEDSR